MVYADPVCQSLLQILSEGEEKEKEIKGGKKDLQRHHRSVLCIKL